MNLLKIVLALCVVTGYFGNTSFAQSGSAENASAAEQTEAPELTRAERRAQRNAERDAARAAERSAEQAAAASTDSSASDDEMICRRESVTGTHRRIRICRTKSQMDEMRAESQRILREGARDAGL